MAFAAMTPGFPIAAAMLSGASIGIFIAHAQVASALQLQDLVADDYAIGVIVTLLASTGMAVVVRVATDAEARATRLSARNRDRVDVLERVNRIVARFDGSQPVQNVIQAVVDDIAREFEITLVSLYLPTGRNQLTMVGVAGYPAPFHVIDIGVGIIGRAAATQQTQFVPDVLADPDYRAARDDVRSEVAAPVVHSGELLGVVNFEGTLEHPIEPRRWRSPRWSSTRCRRRSARPGSTMSGAIACTPSSACSRSAGRSWPTSTGRASWPRSSTPWPSCWAPMSWPSSRVSPTECSGSRPARASRRRRSGRRT